MKTLQSIVVGIDFSECSRAALGRALHIASWSGSAVHPVHVIEIPALDRYESSAYTPLQLEIRAGLLAEADARWREFVEGVAGADGLEVTVGFGPRLECLRAHLLTKKAELLVLGAYGATRPNVGMGTLASGCIRAVPVDVLVVRDNYRDPFRTVAVGVDFSDNSKEALQSAAMVARGEGGKLRAVHVVPDTPDTYARLRTELMPQLQAFVERATSELNGLDVRCHVYPYSGYRSGILEFATLVNADLVVTGTRGKSNLRDVVLGSTAEKVLRDTVVAVWASKLPQQETSAA
jgi:nucleotide-binding universal stress UspA family protein